MRIMTDSSAQPPPLQQPQGFVRAGKGFARISLGLLMLLLFLAGVLSVRKPALIQLPSYVIGTLILYWGVLQLPRACMPGKTWPRAVYASFGLLFLQLYLAPFYTWWNDAPYSSYFFVHLFALLFSILLLLYLLNRLARELAKQLGDAEFMVESTLSSWAVVGMGLFPAGTLFLLAALLSVLHKTTVPFEFRHLLDTHIPTWAQALFYLPVTFTIAVCWKASNRALRRAAAR